MAMMGKRDALTALLENKKVHRVGAPKEEFVYLDGSGEFLLRGTDGSFRRVDLNSYMPRDTQYEIWRHMAACTRMQAVESLFKGGMIIIHSSNQNWYVEVHDGVLSISYTGEPGTWEASAAAMKAHPDAKYFLVNR